MFDTILFTQALAFGEERCRCRTTSARKFPLSMQFDGTTDCLICRPADADEHSKNPVNNQRDRSEAKMDGWGRPFFSLKMNLQHGIPPPNRK
jgi:hypothetical protein